MAVIVVGRRRVEWQGQFLRMMLADHVSDMRSWRGRRKIPRSKLWPSAPARAGGVAERSSRRSSPAAQGTVPLGGWAAGSASLVTVSDYQGPDQGECTLALPDGQEVRTGSARIRRNRRAITAAPHRPEVQRRPRERFEGRTGACSTQAGVRATAHHSTRRGQVGHQGQRAGWPSVGHSAARCRSILSVPCPIPRSEGVSGWGAVGHGTYVEVSTGSVPPGSVPPACSLGPQDPVLALGGDAQLVPGTGELLVVVPLVPEGLAHRGGRHP
jgi:hypothetical protein